MQDLERGTRVGEYVIESVLGAGAFGTVYRGVQPVIGKVVAIKVLNRQDPDTLSRFVAEARAVNAIRHPNLVDIFSFGELGDGRPYYVMELLNGEAFDAYLERLGGRIEPAPLLTLVRPLARALDAAHAVDIIHRDLKPSNIFLTADIEGRIVPKLLDFGVAKLAGDAQPKEHKTGTGHVIGTPSYISPEQCRGPDIDHRSDIYALGCVVFRALTGVPVFRAPTVVELLMKQLQEAPPRLSEVCPDLPPEIDAPVAAMLEKAPEARPPSMAAAVAGLESAIEAAGLPRNRAPEPVTLQDEPALSWTDSVSASMPRSPREPGGRWLFGGIALLVLGVAALPFVLQGTPPSPAPEAPAGFAVQTPPAVSTPPVAETVSITFAGLPEGARVMNEGGSVLATHPDRVRLRRSEQPVALRIEAEGFEPMTTLLTTDRSSTVSVAMTPKPPPPPPKKPRPKRPRPSTKERTPDRDSLEDPY